MNTNKKAFLPIILAGLVALAGIGFLFYGTLSYFTAEDKTVTTITTGTVDIKLEEDAPFNGKIPEEGVVSAEKTFRGISLGSKKTYVRAELVNAVEFKNPKTGNWETFGGIPSSAIKYDIDPSTSSSWVLRTEQDSSGVMRDFYYYTKILNNNEKTSDFKITNIHIDGYDKANLPDEYKDGQFRINILVQIEGTQASNEAYKLNWNIDSLPAGVEPFAK